MNNLIHDKSLQKQGLELKQELFNWLKETGGQQIPLKRPANMRFDNLYKKTY